MNAAIPPVFGASPATGGPRRPPTAVLWVVAGAALVLVLVLLVVLLGTVGGPGALGVTRIVAGSYATEVAVSAQGGTIYVGTSDGVAVVDPAAGRRRGLIRVVGVEDLVLGADGQRAYLNGNTEIDVVDLQANLVAEPIALPATTPFGTRLAMSADPRTVIVLMHAQNARSSSIGIVDTRTRTVRAVGRVDGVQPELAVTPDGTKAYLGGSVEGGPVAVDLGTGAVRPVSGTRGGTTTGKPAVAPDGRHAYAVVGGEVVEIDTATDTVSRHLDAGLPAVLAVTPDSRSLVAVDGVAGTLRQVSLDDGATRGTAEVGPYPRAVAVSRDGRYAHVTTGNDVATVALASGST